MKSKNNTKIPAECVGTLAKNIKNFREEKKITQLQLANKIGVSRSYICQLQYGIRISMSSAKQIADALEVSLEDLLEIELPK